MGPKLKIPYNPDVYRKLVGDGDAPREQWLGDLLGEVAHRNGYCGGWVMEDTLTGDELVVGYPEADVPFKAEDFIV